MTTKEEELICVHTVEAALIGICRKGNQIGVSRGESRILTSAIFYAFSRLAKEFPQRFPHVYFTEGPQGTVPISKGIEDILFDMGACGLTRLGGDFRTEVIPKETKLVWKESLENSVSLETLEELIILSGRFKELVQEFKGEKQARRKICFHQNNVRD